MTELKKLRILKGKQLSEVANDVGISKQRLFQIEQKGTKATTQSSEEMMRKLAAYYGIDVFALMGEDNLRIVPKDEAEWKSFLKAMNAIAKGKGAR